MKETQAVIGRKRSGQKSLDEEHFGFVFYFLLFLGGGRSLFAKTPLTEKNNRDRRQAKRVLRTSARGKERAKPTV